MAKWNNRLWAFTALGIFGAYSESIGINMDKTYLPIMWVDKDNYIISKVEGGNLEYSSSGNKLKLKGGVMDLELEIIKFTDTDLWFKISGNQYKFIRKIKH